MQSNSHVLIDRNRVRGSNHLTFERQANGVAALQYGERAQCIQRVGRSCECLMPFLERSVHGGSESLFAQLDAMCPRANERPTTAGLFETESEVIDALRHTPDAVL